MEQIEQTKKFDIHGKRLFLFFLVIFCFVIIPALILSYSVYRFLQTEEEELIFNLKSNMQRMTSELRRNLSAEFYFCRLFDEYNLAEVNNPSSTYESCLTFCKNIKERFGSEIDFVFVKNNGKIGYCTNDNYLNIPSKIWFDAFCYIRFHESREEGVLRNGYEGSIEAVREVLGPQIVRNTLRIPFQDQAYSLYWVDSSNKIPPSAVYPFKWGGFFVFISKDLLKDKSHLKYCILDIKKNDNFIAGIYDLKNKDGFWGSNNIKYSEEVKNSILNSEAKGSNFSETNNYYICHDYLTNKDRAFVLLEKKNTNSELVLKTCIIFLLYCFLSWYVIKYFWNTIFLQIPGTASIRLKLAFLFLYASGIPLLSLGVITHEYEMHKRRTLIEEARTWSVENLLGIEQRYLSYLKKICNILDDYVDKWSPYLKTKVPSYDETQKVYEESRKYGAFDFYCISSDTSYIISEEGVFKYTGALDSIKFVDQKTRKGRIIKKSRYEELSLVNIIVKKLCSDMNGKEIPNAILSKLELIAENIIQKSFPEIIYTIIETLGNIKEWGFGKKSNMTFFKFISLNNNAIVDYVVLISWYPNDSQRLFIEKIIPEANRNPKNFRFIAFDRFYGKTFPEKYIGKIELERFARRALQKPTEELEIINFEGEDYIAISFLGRNIYNYSFVGLYPMRNIDNVIKKQSSLYWILGFFCLILSVGLAQLLTKSFVMPLQKLQDGALAIENRNFEHRLSGFSIDEFGEVGGIFNKVMVGLEELEVAKIVQESMFPKPEFAQGNFSIFGKSVTMIDVGGDYLDFFKIDDNSFAVLVGDVAGHGVGAAVIMAMAKAAILGGEEYLRSPALILNSLHKMILATKNAKQRKIMTFQYLYVNSETGENLYGNAGACSPWLIRHSEQSVQEIKMAGAALGAFKRAVYKEMPLDLKPGDAVVFYTDGIVECKDKNGEMLGYERLKNMLLNCWDENPETYYNNIFKSYVDFVGKDAEAGDDLTFVFLMYNPIKL